MVERGVIIILKCHVLFEDQSVSLYRLLTILLFAILKLELLLL